MSTENNDRQALLEEAKQLGLEFPNNIKTDKLATLIDESKFGDTKPVAKKEATMEVQ